MQKKNLPPSAASLIESTRSIGYSLPAAVADIVDNSLAAESTIININYFPVSAPYIFIADNGRGMSFSELLNSMKYGSKNPLEERDTNDLGRYGLGLKTASLAQCQKLTVISKKDGVISACRWDLQYIREENNWSLLVLEEKEILQLPGFNYLQEIEHGTVVLWQELDRLISTGDYQRDVLGAKMEKVREHLRLVFHRFLTGKDTPFRVSIKFNGMELEPIDPFLTSKSTRAMADEKILVRDDQIVIVRPYILPHISNLTATELESLGGKDGLRKSQGFYVYRNKRLVVWGTWFRMMVKGDLSKLARIQVDIPNTLDDLWTLDIKKSIAIPPEEVQHNLRKIIDRIAEKSKQTWIFRGKKERNTQNVEPWQRLKTRHGGFLYQINHEHILIKNILSKHPDMTRPLYSLLTLIEERLPLNSLYIDMVQDEKIENNDEKKPEEILEKLKDILLLFPTENDKINAFKTFISIPPFSDFEEYINSKAKEDGFFL